MDDSAQSADRQIRVFLSSTFRDMQEEREILIKKVFPQLRALCEERAVTCTEVDLRWGITTEQAAEGRVLPLCLEEIRRCRPYFIGLLGERYGWVPEAGSIPPSLIEAQPWLREHLQHSVTELEILHGVLREPPMHGRAYFYFRDPRHLESVPAERRQDFTAESAEAAARLTSLKQKIRAARDARMCRLREGYASPEQLGAWVLEDLTRLVDDLYPESRTPDPLAQEAVAHEAYARRRRLAFVGREDLIERLNEHGATSSTPLVLTGPAGSGKSALLAEWVARWRRTHPDNLIIQHYTGSTPDSADWQGIVSRILGELKRAFAIPDDLPHHPDALRTALAAWMPKAATSRTVLLVLDALDQLGEQGGARQLTWLPVGFPANFRVLVSSLPGESLDALRRREWAELDVPLLASSDIAPAARAYFSEYSKTPPPAIVAHLEATAAAHNPLFLRAVLDELRQFGRYEELEARAAHYLAAPDLPALFDRILGRWEEDFGEALVRQSFRLIWAARRGLTESEVLDLLGENGQPLPRAIWTPLYLAAESSLGNRAGFVGLFHDHFRRAVQARCLPDPEQQSAAHLRLADYFDRRAVNITVEESGMARVAAEFPPRMLEEWCWQLRAAGEWERLQAALADVAFVAVLFTKRPTDTLGYWSDLLARDTGAMRTVYRGVMESPDRFGAEVGSLQLLFYQTGHLDEAERLAESWMRRVGRDPAELAATLSLRALIRQSRGELRAALELLREAEQLYRERGEQAALAEALGNQANIHFATGDWDRAIALHREVQQLARRAGATATLGTALNNEAAILARRGDLADALERYRQSEQIARNHEDPRALAASLGGQANVLASQGTQERALALLAEVEMLARQIHDIPVLVAALGNQGSIHLARGELARAGSALREQERLCREGSYLEELARALNNQACLAVMGNDLDSALAKLEEKEQLCRQIGSPALLATTLGNRAVLLQQRGELDAASRLLQEAERIGRELGDLEIVANSLAARAQVLRSQGDRAEAMRLAQEEGGIRRRLSNAQQQRQSIHQQLAIASEQGALDDALRLLREKLELEQQEHNAQEECEALLGQALLLQAQGQLRPALQQLTRLQQLCEQLRERGRLATCLGVQGVILKDLGDLDQADRLLREQERLSLEIGDQNGVQVALGNRAIVRKVRGDLAGAMELLHQQEQLARTLGAEADLATCLANQANILLLRRDVRPALALLADAEDVFRRLGDWQRLPACLINRARVLIETLHQYEEAAPLVDEAATLVTRYGLQPLLPHVQWLRRALSQRRA